MTIGGSIFLIAVGAILAFAVTASVAGIEIQTVGVILMVAGAVGLVIGLFLLTSERRRVGTADRRVVYEDRRDPMT
jgi:Flp pilus assembly protein protease CpaA